MVLIIECRVTINGKVTIVLCNGALVRIRSATFLLQIHLNIFKYFHTFL